MLNIDVHWPGIPITKDGELIELPSPQSFSLFLPERTQVAQIELVNGRSRNPVFRVYHIGSNQAVVVKFFLPQFDCFYDSRFRREEKMLSLLNRWFNNHVPNVYGGVIAETYAALIEQDVGRQSLDDLLVATTSEEERFSLMSNATALLIDFHRACQRHYSVFYRTAFSTELDRLTKATYVRRAEIALARLFVLEKILQQQDGEESSSINNQHLHKISRDMLGDEFFKRYFEQVVCPLLAAPRQILHNSFSPFHIIWDTIFSLVDFETVTVGAAQVDLAELLGAPEANLAEHHQLILVEQYYKEMDAEQRGVEWADFIRDFYNALVVRSLDYAGTTASRAINYLAEGDEGMASSNLTRTSYYLSVVLERFAIPELNKLVDKLRSEVWR